MRFDVVTLFPELFTPHLAVGITRRAFTTGLVDVRLWQLRDYADDNYRRVDDRPYGGGPGMVMLVEPLLRALDAVRAERGEVPVVHFTPTGRRLDQAVVQEFATGPGAVLLCGRYEGIDQRFIDRRVTHEISLGDFVLSGGELPALALLDAVARLQPGVIPAPSHEQDSFGDGLLEGPSYSRPEHLLLDGEPLPVPPVLLSGHHGEIARWRRECSLERTARRRPELITAARAAGRLSRADERFLAALGL
ncbi:tRNA (guanosine(37)-N1)-methyltransferase TrmD [Rubrivivax gelatinosus]|uniref:tRNA (guanine-N(1)-)-methyltransferase n=1 Tax=Rubrivivax gelatinosus TaxID=28068 RepID=A0ABS1DW39_RUBGE|nr:tRNA (guanosine(37)-N1)-methyltransferase TrmD [Rubrivivax gelatinosus]MBK1613497.1 tRNA (guanosine(37)-N1)-methyltransferase TrmD [Rubrivivax gelatinosus]MBK1713190.1 tRNA (guanosine(37)-N1)-methyltransferase TrmD [Rubrivivax gelatinosus]